jgi:hypothetical protein
MASPWVRVMDPTREAPSFLVAHSLPCGTTWMSFLDVMVIVPKVGSSFAKHREHSGLTGTRVAQVTKFCTLVPKVVNTGH